MKIHSFATLFCHANEPDNGCGNQYCAHGLHEIAALVDLLVDRELDWATLR